MRVFTTFHIILRVPSLRAFVFIMLITGSSLCPAHADVICTVVTKMLAPQGEDAAFSFIISGKHGVFSYYMFDDDANKASRYMKIIEKSLKEKKPIRLTVNDSEVDNISPNCK